MHIVVDEDDDDDDIDDVYVNDKYDEVVVDDDHDDEYDDGADYGDDINQLLVSCAVRLMCSCGEDNDSLRTRSIWTVLAVSRERLSTRQCGLFLYKERHCSAADRSVSAYDTDWPGHWHCSCPIVLSSQTKTASFA